MDDHKPVIEEVPRELIKAELKPDYLLRATNNGGNEIFVVTAAECPNIMREIGRLREMAFREAGGGTGCEVDIDELDTVEGGYKQLFVWDPAAEQIVGGYRYIISKVENPKYFSTEHYFVFSNFFRRNYLPYTIELGRSFVQPAYQGTRRNPKGIYAMDNLWDGLGALIVHNPQARYFFGKVTMYVHYNREARNILLYFMHKYFPDRDHLVEPRFPIDLQIDTEAMARLFSGGSYREDYKILVRELRARGEFIPPMINSYMSLSPAMRVFSTVSNPDFGDVEETGILVPIKEMYPNKTERHTRGLERIERAISIVRERFQNVKLKKQA